MRISDWSSDVCSSDLSGRKSPPKIVKRPMRHGHFHLLLHSSPNPLDGFAESARTIFAVAARREELVADVRWPLRKPDERITRKRHQMCDAGLGAFTWNGPYALLRIEQLGRAHV